jgi:hypothetical protein
MSDPIFVDVFSAAAVPIEMMFNSTPLAQGTGFIWNRLDIYYLVTNWHNVSGKNFFTAKNLSPTSGLPNRVKIYLNKKDWLGHRFSEIFDLYDTDGRHQSGLCTQVS